jgi:hypothetical protein
MRSEMNTGIMLLRPTRGGKALVHAWRRAIAATAAGTPTNDQLVFDHLVLSSKLGSVLKDPSVWAKWRHAVRGSGGGGSGGSGGSGGGSGGSSSSLGYGILVLNLYVTIISGGQIFGSAQQIFRNLEF